LAVDGRAGNIRGEKPSDGDVPGFVMHAVATPTLLRPIMATARSILIRRAPRGPFGIAQWCRLNAKVSAGG
jgi:hypothetical protein